MIARFHKLCFSTLIAVYFLILVGGTVRSTGSGMGCPDWPKCFDSWIPPTTLEQLPQNYKEIYSSYRHEKNVKFTKYLALLGAQQTADRLLNDKSILETPDFDATKTWIEYVNRLVGVTVGFLILLLTFSSFRMRKSHRKIFILSVFVLLIVLLQGWFGSIVVSTNLTSWTITVHMLLALLIVALLSLLLGMSSLGRLPQTADISMPTLVYWLLIGSMAALLAQIFLGTIVRGAVDEAMSSGISGDTLMTHLGSYFWVHRSFSWVILLCHAALFYMLRKAVIGRLLSSLLLALTMVILASGAGMAYFGISPLVQPLHLLLAAILFGLQWQLFYRLNLYLKFGVQYNHVGKKDTA